MHKLLSEFKEKWIWKKPKPGPYRYKSVSEMTDSLKDRNAWLQEIIMSCYYSCKRLIEVPGDAVREVKWAKQRSERGWSDRDCWGAHYYFARVIKEVCIDLKKYKHGIPTCIYRDGVDEETADKRWSMVLENIIWTFAAAEKISESEWVLPSNGKSFTIKEKQIMKKYSTDSDLGHMHWMTPDEISRYNRGWDLFKQYFYSLWD